MNHLTFEEIVEYVSLKKLDEEALLLASKVDTHIRECEKCLELVRAVRTIHDEFVKIKLGKSFPEFIKDAVALNGRTKRRLVEVRSSCRSLEK